MEFGLIGLVLIGLVFSIISFIDNRKIKKKMNKELDLNIEWYGDQIYMKEKVYGIMKDDYREEITDSKKYENDKEKDIKCQK